MLPFFYSNISVLFLHFSLLEHGLAKNCLRHPKRQARISEFLEGVWMRFRRNDLSLYRDVTSPFFVQNKNVIGRKNATVEQREASLKKGTEFLCEKELHVWYELVQCLDKKLVLFLRPCKGKESKAWEILCKSFKSAKRPRLQKLISSLTSIRKKANVSAVDYIT